MKCLIYQFWNGIMPTYAAMSATNMERYAKKIGADYKLSLNEHFFKWHKNPLARNLEHYFNALRPVYDDGFEKYDFVLFVDMDVFVRSDEVDIFKEQSTEDFHIAMAEEPEQIKERQLKSGLIKGSNDQKYDNVIAKCFKSDPPRDPSGKLRIFNSGVVLYRKPNQLRNLLLNPDWYILTINLAGLPRFYSLDQNFLGAVIGQSDIKFRELNQHWNQRVRDNQNNDHLIKEAKFLHLQVSGKNTFGRDELTKYLGILGTAV